MSLLPPQFQVICQHFCLFFLTFFCELYAIQSVSSPDSVGTITLHALTSPRERSRTLFYIKHGQPGGKEAGRGEGGSHQPQGEGSGKREREGRALVFCVFPSHSVHPSLFFLFFCFFGALENTIQYELRQRYARGEVRRGVTQHARRRSTYQNLVSHLVSFAHLHATGQLGGALQG